MKVLFWFSLLLIVYTYGGYPVWIYVLSRLRPHLWRRAPFEPGITVIMAVHNGAALLRNKMDQLLNLDYPPELVDIIVVSDGSSDGTEEILRIWAHPRLRAVICRKHRGKAAAINEGMQRGTGSILVFTDLRQKLERGAIRSLVSNFADPKVGCATGELCLHLANKDNVTGAIGGLYWRYEQRIRTCEGLVDSVLGVSGAFYALRRELATELPDGLILDDMYQPLSVVRQGYRAVLDAGARFYDSLPENSGSEFLRKVRTQAGNFQLLQLSPWLLRRENRLRFKLISHKLLRLIVPLLLLTTLVTSAWLARHSLLYAAALIVQIGIYALAALGMIQGLPLVGRISAAANAFCMLNAAVVVGFYKFLFTQGPLWKIWVSTAAPSAAAAERNRSMMATVE